MDLDDNMVCPAPVCIYEQLHIGVVKLRVIPLADLFFGVDITFITSKTEIFWFFWLFENLSCFLILPIDIKWN